MAKTKVCKYCGRPGHTKFSCPRRPRKPIPKKGKIGKRWTEHRKYWIKRHGGETATWICYLQIHPDCPRVLTIETLTLDHVIPRSNSPHLRFEDDNLKPACSPCNNKKSSIKLERLKK